MASNPLQKDWSRARNQAINHLAQELGANKTLILLFIIDRTLGQGKKSDYWPLNEFYEGVFNRKGKQTHCGVPCSRSSSWRYIQDLANRNLIIISKVTLTGNVEVNQYEVDLDELENIISRLEKIMARKKGTDQPCSPRASAMVTVSIGHGHGEHSLNSIKESLKDSLDSPDGELLSNIIPKTKKRSTDAMKKREHLQKKDGIRMSFERMVSRYELKSISPMTPANVNQLWKNHVGNDERIETIFEWLMEYWGDLERNDKPTRIDAMWIARNWRWIISEYRHGDPEYKYTSRAAEEDKKIIRELTAVIKNQDKEIEEVRKQKEGTSSFKPLRKRLTSW